MKASNLKKLNYEILTTFSKEYNNVQLGRFAGTKILFIDSFPAVKDRGILTSKTGKYLTAMMSASDEFKDLSWNDVSLTYVVKAYGLEDSTLEDYEKFFPYLLKQIDVIKPHVIACLGKQAGSVFGFDEFYYAKGYSTSIVCAYPHPSHVLRKNIAALKAEELQMRNSLEELLNMSIHNET
jgi:uracil-DNA glycosylase family 4